ncbi:hypothetical protein C1Y40_05567 [Mycobacterium talmoniae]|uniref:Uncharacterized protein n=1 Tax=Mycobacterium talmoniae TaxID=1858794 RepID=A0A2S8BCA3_9MYCO|nr:hypothetical protein C1Y40_05567 [Mycobacterium talmoniae]
MFGGVAMGLPRRSAGVRYGLLSGTSHRTWLFRLVLNTVSAAPALLATTAPIGPMLAVFSAPDSSLFWTSPGPVPAT